MPRLPDPLPPSRLRSVPLNLLPYY